jgi:hypothetical protein
MVIYMPSIPATYDAVMNFFKSDKSEELPEHLRGVWTLEQIENQSILMSFNNAEFDKEKRRLTVNLYEKGTWLYKEDHYFTKWFGKLIQYAYQFDFDEEYRHAEITMKLGKLPLIFHKSVMDWTLDFVDGKMIRTTKVFGSPHTYEAFKVTHADDIEKKLADYDDFYFCKE